jgi:hypothetical protein
MILRGQAAALARDTNNVLVGDVRTQANDQSSFSLFLYVVVPSLDDFSYLVCEYKQPISSYPGELLDHVNGRKYKVRSEVEFERALKSVLGSPKVVEVLDDLLAQATSAP